MRYKSGDDETIPTERIWVFKHRGHHKHYTLRSFLFMCGHKGAKNFWTQRVDLQTMKEWTSIRQGWVGIWLCKACSEMLISVGKFTNEHHHPKHDGYVYISEMFFAPSTVRKAILLLFIIYSNRIFSPLHWLDGQKITLLSLLRRLFMSCAIYVEEKRRPNLARPHSTTRQFLFRL